MNPFATVTDLNKAFERYALYMPLVQLDSALTPRPWLATTWDTAAVGSDSLDITFHLRTDISWQDGVRTTAHDVARTFELARDARSAFVDAAALALYAPRAEVLDTFTVRFRMQRHADYLEAFALLTPLPSHVIGNTAPEELARHPLGTAPVGNGPFRFERRDAQEWVFASNPSFPAELGGPPPLDRLVYRTIPEQTSLVTELLTGQVHVASVRPLQVPQLEATEGVRVVTFPVPNWIFMALNTRLPWFDARDERRAIAMAVDRRALVDGIMGGHNTVGASSVTPVHRAFDATATVRHDPDSARVLLELAGWRDRDGDGVREDASGRPLRFRLKVWHGTGSYRELAEAIQAQLARVGIAAQPEIVEFNTFVTQVQGRADARRGRVRDFDVAISNWTDNMLRKDDTFLLHSRHAGSPRQWTGFNSARLDVLLDSITVATDSGTSNRLWREYQHALVDESPLIFLFYALGINGVRTELNGVPDGDPRGPIATVGRWWLQPAR
jgi:peptide/nickel transport system substrate-binding protein